MRASQQPHRRRLRAGGFSFAGSSPTQARMAGRCAGKRGHPRPRTGATWDSCGGAIRDARLYRTEYGTFEDYCQDRWGVARMHAGRMIAAAQEVVNCNQLVAKPETESQARLLTRLAHPTSRKHGRRQRSGRNRNGDAGRRWRPSTNRQQTPTAKKPRSSPDVQVWQAIALNLLTVC